MYQKTPSYVSWTGLKGLWFTTVLLFRLLEEVSYCNICLFLRKIAVCFGSLPVAIGTAAAIPGTVVHRVAPVGADGCVRFGHPSGTLKVGAEVRRDGRHWAVSKVLMSRSARRLMEGWVRVPAETP